MAEDSTWMDRIREALTVDDAVYSRDVAKE